MIELFDKLKPGEIVLVEYSSKDDPSIIFAEVMKWAEAKGFQTLVTDLFNRVDICLRRIKLEVPECELLKKPKFIEIGYHDIA
ncbi:MAG: hypothetical protein PWP39_527 [Pyrococcus sp.]|uniref:DUF257 family protein n=1 Tax=Pyrococcus sp. TaxID=33866 RepID=UPI00258C84D6|nr:DUF257 family protein [Pyrococcus sp.]MDK2869292.1 hypothetical protein [Pyrococcus sp.]